MNSEMEECCRPGTVSLAGQLGMPEPADPLGTAVSCVLPEQPELVAGPKTGVSAELSGLPDSAPGAETCSLAGQLVTTDLLLC